MIFLCESGDISVGARLLFFLLLLIVAVFIFFRNLGLSIPPRRHDASPETRARPSAIASNGHRSFLSFFFSSQF